MDRIEWRILSILQSAGQTSMARLSDQVGLSLSACHRRVRNLEAAGVISHYAARLNRRKIGLSLQVFIEVKLISQRKEDITAFEHAIDQMPDVLECHLISGDFDYLIRVAGRDTEDFEDIYRNRLSQIPSVQQMKSLMSLSTVKEFRGYNLENLLDPGR